MIPPLALTYYGDDFTGSTDVMEVLTWAGLPTALFTEEPTPERLARFPEARAIGVAGDSRSRPPEWMDRHLPPIFERLKGLRAPLCHYKVCSTFDSSARVGSIGRALELGQQVFAAPWVPVIVGAPALDRYQVFGNLFATVQGRTFRLDRHPTMSRHPVTPMDEADLRAHLGRQTTRRVGLVDLLALRSSQPEAALDAERDQAEAILFDVIDESSLAAAGRLLWERRPAEQAFCVGSSGIEYALVAYWRTRGWLAEAPCSPSAQASDRIVVVSGSCSPETEASLRRAFESGYLGVRLDARQLASDSEAARQAALTSSLEALAAGRSVALYSALGLADPHLVPGEGELQRRLGEQTGQLLREILIRSGARRAIVCGGDTSSHAVRQLGLYALTATAPMSPGSPLCQAFAEGPLDGLEIVLKGGQRGSPDFFENVRRGRVDRQA